jgi:radical SAM protein with 4Fe4S-binding SPASM domain
VLLGGLTWLRINISAATPESYRRIHGVDLFDRVIATIRETVATKQRSCSTTTIGMQMVLTRENLDDIVPLSRLGRELGVDYLVIKPCSDDPLQSLNAPTGEYLAMAEVFREAAACSSNDYQVVVKVNKLVNRGVKDFGACFGTRFIINISGDGSVFPCGHFFNSRRDEFYMGNILHSSLKEIIASERYWEVQERISTIDVNCECETNCRHYYVSGFLWKLKNPPPHLDFI